jgi:hypothetical protein
LAPLVVLLAIMLATTLSHVSALSQLTVPLAMMSCDNVVEYREDVLYSWLNVAKIAKK